MWRRRSWFSLKGKAGIPGQTEGRPATSIGPRVPPVGSLQQRALGVQQRQIEGYAYQHGLTLNQVFVERGVSGSIPLEAVFTTTVDCGLLERAAMPMPMSGEPDMGREHWTSGSCA